MRASRYWVSILVLNAALAFGLRTAVPDQPAHSDRQEYEYVGQRGLAPGCTMTVYCYRLLVPVLLERIPLPSELRWRWHELLANTLAGFVMAVATARAVSSPFAPLLATLAAQTGFGFTFTAYDPYTADPMVFLIASLMTLAWLADWPVLALGLAAVGVLAKETVALVATAAALAAVVGRRHARWRLWVVQAVLAWVIVLGFHWVMDTFYGWGISKNVAAQFSRGSWLAIWLANMDSLWRIAFLLFVPFGFVWIFALLGFRVVRGRLRALAIGSLLPMLALNYVQNPERALANAFFVVIPLAVVFLSRVPWPAALFATVTNGLLTAKVGLSTTWLPSSALLLIPAAASAAWVLWIALGRTEKDG